MNKIQEKKKGDDIQQYFAEVADYLFKHVAIQAGETRFTFAEIEMCDNAEINIYQFYFAYSLVIFLALAKYSSKSFVYKL